ncbi:MAG: alpha/beta fold hydrolase [Candidatus Rokubacteria bacterium]|nr:alpha/beta fold hydrolase [Candidatus Rokubacteria bacterium]
MANLVFIHGAGEDGRVWDRQVAAFSAAHRVLAVDLPGRGARRAEPPFTSHEENAKDVLRQMDVAAMARAVLVGHSMGGGVALVAALNHPDRLSGLVLVATGARLKMHPDLLEKARQRAEDPGASNEPPVRLGRTVAESVSPEVLDFLRARTMSAPPKTIYADFQANNNFDVMERLGEISAPILVIGADEDRMTPPKFSEYLAQKIHGAHLIILSSCGHYPQVEQEADFNRTLADFLKTLA